MNARLCTTVLSVLVLGLSACAGMHEKPDSAYVAPQRSQSTMDADEAYMAAVERIARRRGIEVIWVHAPRKMVAKNTDN